MQKSNSKRLSRTKEKEYVNNRVEVDHYGVSSFALDYQRPRKSVRVNSDVDGVEVRMLPDDHTNTDDMAGVEDDLDHADTCRYCG